METNLSEHELAEIGFAAIGTDVRVDRRVAVFNASAIRLGSHVRIDAFTVLAGGQAPLVIGSYVHISASCYLSAGDGGITFGDFVALAPGVAVHGHSDDYRTGMLTGGVVPREVAGGYGAPIIFEPHVIVGSRSVVLPGVTLGRAAAVGALTVVRRSVASGRVISGNPQQDMGPRNLERLDELEATARLQLG